ncbi:MAG: helix-turn-helix domain-containing protein [Mycobacterium sp.]
MFLAHGYEGSGMDQIASQSGAARRTLYNQFPRKRALLDVAIYRLWEKIL